MITEEKIWDYLDGSLNEADRKQVAWAIANDNVTADLFQEISALHAALKTESMLMPSALFADNVMAAIPTARAYAPAANISSKTMFLFALPTIAVIIAFAVVIIKFHVALSFNMPFRLPAIDWGRLNLYMILTDVLLVIYLMDYLPEKKRILQIH